MKKHLLTVAAAAFLALGVNAQSMLIDADFNDGNAAGFTVHDGDGNPRSGTITSIDSWGMIWFTSDPSNQFFASFAEYTAPGDAEDWLMSAPVAIPAEGDVSLSWDSYRYVEESGSELQVAISVNGGAPGFTNYTTIETITDETSGAWNTNTLDLNAYAGQTINIAFVHTSTATQYYFIDNIQLSALVELDLGITALNIDEFPSMADQDITGVITNLGSATVTSFDLEWTMDGQTIGSETVSGVSIDPLGGTYNFTSSTSFAAPEYSSFDIEVTISNPNAGIETTLGNNSMSGQIHYWTGLPTKRVLFEEGTGTWCGWCPRGAVVLETMSNNFPETFIGVAVHNGDPMVVVAHDAAVGAKISGYPGGVWNHEDGTGVSQGIADAEYAARILELSPFDVTSESFWYAPTRTITTTVSVTPVANLTGTYKIGGIIMEDGVTGTTAQYAQANYYSGGQQGNLSGAGLDWHNEANPVPASKMVYDHVSRALFDGGYDGKPGSLPTTLVAGTTYKYTFSQSIDASVDEEEVSLVVFVTNEDNSVSNVNKEKLNTTIDNISEVNANVMELDMYPNPTNDVVTLNVELLNNSSITVSISNMVGAVVYSEQASLQTGSNTKTIDVSNFPAGIYTVNVVSGAESTTQKLVIEKN